MLKFQSEENQEGRSGNQAFSRQIYDGPADLLGVWGEIEYFNGELSVVVTIVPLTQCAKHGDAVVTEILHERTFEFGVGYHVTHHARTHVGNLKGNVGRNI